MTTGIDISNHQGNVNWPALKSRYKLGFAFCKATEGGGRDKYRDKYFARNWREIGKLGLVRGAYHFARPKRSSGTEQAAFFHSFVQANGGLKSGDWLCLDIEDDGDKSNAALTRWCKDFMTELDRRTEGVGLIIYTGRVFAGKISSLTKWPLWVADYRKPARPGKLAGSVPGWGSGWLIHQYTDAPLDLNYSRKSAAELRALAAGKKASPRPAPAPTKPSAPSKPAVTIPDGSPLLRRGDRGTLVKQLQHAMNALLNFAVKLKVDGDFGPVTEEGVRKLQRYGKIKVDGVYGPKSAAVLRRVLSRR